MSMEPEDLFANLSFLRCRLLSLALLTLYKVPLPTKCLGALITGGAGY